MGFYNRLPIPPVTSSRSGGSISPLSPLPLPMILSPIPTNILFPASTSPPECQALGGSSFFVRVPRSTCPSVRRLGIRGLALAGYWAWGKVTPGPEFGPPAGASILRLIPPLLLLPGRF